MRDIRQQSRQVSGANEVKGGSRAPSSSCTGKFLEPGIALELGVLVGDLLTE